MLAFTILVLVSFARDVLGKNGMEKTITAIIAANLEIFCIDPPRPFGLSITLRRIVELQESSFSFFSRKIYFFIHTICNCAVVERRLDSNTAIPTSAQRGKKIIALCFTCTRSYAVAREKFARRTLINKN
jgi:hypothetical protein